MHQAGGGALKVGAVTAARDVLLDGATGDRIAVRVSLSPPPRPVFPRGYDFARMIYFSGIGAVGFAVGAPVILEPGEEKEHILARHRHRITERIYKALENDYTPSVTGITAAASKLSLTLWENGTLFVFIALPLFLQMTLEYDAMQAGLSLGETGIRLRVARLVGTLLLVVLAFLRSLVVLAIGMRSVAGVLLPLL